MTYEAPDDRLYRFGDVVPPTSLLPSVSVNLGKGALFVSYEGDDTGAPLQIGWEVWKTAAGRPCQLREFQGAGLRCEPLESLRFAPRYFEDVMCVRPLSEPLTPLCGALPEVLSESVVLPDTCVVERQYRPGAPYIGAVYERVGMACQALAMSPGMLLRLTPVAPGELPSASLVVE